MGKTLIKKYDCVFQCLCVYVWFFLCYIVNILYLYIWSRIWFYLIFMWYNTYGLSYYYVGALQKSKGTMVGKYIQYLESTKYLYEIDITYKKATMIELLFEIVQKTRWFWDIILRMFGKWRIEIGAENHLSTDLPTDIYINKFHHQLYYCCILLFV